MLAFWVHAPAVAEGVSVPFAGEEKPQSKNLEVMRKFSEQYAKRWARGMYLRRLFCNASAAAMADSG